MSVTTPCEGLLESFTAEVNETYPVGSTLGYIEASVEEAERLNATEPPVIARPWSLPGRDDASADQSDSSEDSPSRSFEIPVGQNGAAFQSPRLRALLQELGIHPDDAAIVPGSGIAGRVTVHDFEAYMEEVSRLPSKKASPMRLAVADSMRRSWTRPLATLGVSISLEPILAHRKTLTPSPGPALYLAKALAIALSEYPQSAGRLVGDKIVLPGINRHWRRRRSGRRRHRTGLC